jgi:hypothetical protein
MRGCFKRIDEKNGSKISLSQLCSEWVSRPIDSILQSPLEIHHHPAYRYPGLHLSKAGNPQKRTGEELAKKVGNTKNVTN